MVDFLLKRGNEVLGSLTLNDNSDFPWLSCDFNPTATYAAYKSLFEEANKLMATNEAEAKDEIWERISSLNLRLESLKDGEEIEPVAIYIEGQQARFRI